MTEPKVKTTDQIRYVCPTCGEESMYADDNVSRYWDVKTQSWEVSDGGMPDERTTLYCGGTCGEETTMGEAQVQGPKFNHAFTLAFSVVSQDPKGEDVTAEMLRAALQKRIEDLDSEGDLAWYEASDAPFDTYEIEEES
jgi:hypothetical protein